MPTNKNAQLRYQILESRIFSYGPQVEVLAPQWLRSQIAEKYGEIVKKYTKVQEDCTVRN